MKISSNACAKINLSLDVGDRRPDGFHDLASVMMSVTLGDLLTLSPADPGDRIAVRCAEGAPEGRENLVFKAAEAFFRACGEKPRDVVFTLEKRIPTAAGLAGGSSDAAAAIRMLNEFCGYPLTDEDLFKIAAGVGSDVPFCLRGGVCLCEGRGEIVTPVRTDVSLRLLIANGGEPVSTAAAYRALDALADRPHRPPDALIAALGRGDTDALRGELFNSFEDAILPRHASARRAKEIMTEYGAASLLSGSGPSVFGVFPDDASRLVARAALARDGFRTFICENVL